MNTSFKITCYIKYVITIFVVFTFFISKGQNPLHISVSNTTFASTDSVLPFWFVANQHGKIQTTGSFFNITEIFIGQQYKKQTKFDYSWGGDLIAAFGNTNYYQINQAFAGFSLKGWEIKGGMYYDEIKYAGLSTSNGNLAKSQNARPVPGIRFSNPEYKPVPFMQKWLDFKFEYEERFLNDNRYVDGAHLHHKSLYAKIRPSTSWNFQVGFEHFVMWGGYSQNENIGQLPEGWKAYWRYVLALPGDSEFPQNDQLNSSGDQLGTYQFEFNKDFSGFSTSFYVSHPWEDNSGLNWHNWPDNLLGFYIDIKDKTKLITDIVYEFTNTRQQSIHDSLYFWDEGTGKWKMKEYDNYFNHGIYVSGFTYHQQVMSSPLFFPVNLSNDISMGILSNRFFSHHLGIMGNISDHLSWKGLLTYVQHLGTYSNPFPDSRKQVSGLLEFLYSNPDFPVDLGLATGADAKNNGEKNFGIKFTIAKAW